MTKNELKNKRHEAYIKLINTPVTSDQYKRIHKEYNELMQQWNNLILSN